LFISGPVFAEASIEQLPPPLPVTLSKWTGTLPLLQVGGVVKLHAPHEQALALAVAPSTRSVGIPVKPAGQAVDRVDANATSVHPLGTTMHEGAPFAHGPASAGVVASGPASPDARPSPGGIASLGAPPSTLVESVPVVLEASPCVVPLAVAPGRGPASAPVGVTAPNPPWSSEHPGPRMALANAIGQYARVRMQPKIAPQPRSLGYAGCRDVNWSRAWPRASIVVRFFFQRHAPTRSAFSGDDVPLPRRCLAGRP
jgi:hypothetical protein